MPAWPQPTVPSAFGGDRIHQPHEEVRGPSAPPTTRRAIGPMSSPGTRAEIACEEVFEEGAASRWQGAETCERRRKVGLLAVEGEATRRRSTSGSSSVVPDRGQPTDKHRAFHVETPARANQSSLGARDVLPPSAPRRRPERRPSASHPREIALFDGLVASPEGAGKSTGLPTCRTDITRLAGAPLNGKYRCTLWRRRSYERWATTASTRPTIW